MISCLFIMHSFGGGAEKTACALITNLDRAHFAPSVCCMRHIPEWREHLPPDVQLIMPEKKGILPFGRILWRAWRLARKSDVVIGSLEPRSIFWAALLGGKKALAWIHKDLSPYFAMKKTWFVLAYTTILRWAMRRSGKVIGVGQGVAGTLNRLFPESKERIGVLYNPLDEKEILAAAAAPLPDELRLCFGKPVILGVGRLVPQKAFHLLIRAHAELLADGVEHHLCILGEGPERNFLRSEAERLGRVESVFLPGYMNPYPIMARAHVLAGSALFEGFGLVILEGMILGAPVVYSDCRSGPRELLGDNEYGLLVPPGDAHALAMALARMFEPKTHAHYSRMALRRGKMLNSLGDNVRAWEDTLAFVVGPEGTLG
ncbi:MAG: glycosyltransferase [Desulfovibrio sp.]|jgi:glycosyltransferase involved in cell wall biosynthesis|nr:glycosyltransferase [Desulfovibrio sp.]